MVWCCVDKSKTMKLIKGLQFISHKLIIDIEKAMDMMKDSFWINIAKIETTYSLTKNLKTFC